MPAAIQDNPKPTRRIAIQGECGSNSHMAALAMLGDVEIVPCSASPEVFSAVVEHRADAAVLPIENSLHGSVAEHYDLLLQHPVRIAGESLLRIRHNLIAAPGVSLEQIRTVLSHPVALSQCRNWLANFPQAKAVLFYDTAGSVKHIMAPQPGDTPLRDTAGVAPTLAAKVYGANVLVAGIEDHAQNLTRFHLIQREADPLPASSAPPDKMSVAFALEHRPGTLVRALESLATTGVDLTRIESRPVPGRPWEYVFYVELRFTGEPMADRALAALGPVCSMVKELGRYAAA
jgi:prephenate dehydratase